MYIYIWVPYRLTDLNRTQPRYRGGTICAAPPSLRYLGFRLYSDALLKWTEGWGMSQT